MAGGMDSFDWLKDRIKKPKVLVDLSGVDELKGIRTTSDGVEIGAMTTLTEIANHPEIKAQYGVLSEAVELVASPQIRNQGTLGGNVSQDARCWYYREGWPCYRAGGNICYADTPVGRNREHAIFGANRCVAVHPSDSAAGADCARREVRDCRRQKASAWWMRKITSWDRRSTSRSMNILQPGDLLTAIRIPAAWAGAKFYFEKVRDRNVWDFPLMNVASAMVHAGGNMIDRIRIAVSAVAPKPMRLKDVEDAVQGKPADATTGEMAGKLAVEGCGSVAVQRVQDSADEKPGEALDQWRRGGEMGLITLGNQSVGKNGSHPYCVVPDLGLRHCRTAFMIVHALYVGIFAGRRRRLRKTIRPRWWPPFPNACRGTRLWRAPFTG